MARKVMPSARCRRIISTNCGAGGMGSLICLAWATDLRPAWIAKPGAALAGGLERSLGPLRNGLTLMLGRGRHDVDGEPK